jgi:Cu-Zn family superoxide dismutase
MLASLAACTGVGAYQDVQRVGSATLVDANGNEAGQARLETREDRLFLSVNVSGLEAGPKGFHLHQIGRCTGPDFKSAAGHLNPYSKTHGSASAQGKHLGDLPNLMVAADGTAQVKVEIEETAQSALEHIFDADGTAIVIHAGPDDLRSDPAGAAGPRIICGEILKA